MAFSTASLGLMIICIVNSAYSQSTESPTAATTATTTRAATTTSANKTTPATTTAPPSEIQFNQNVAACTCNLLKNYCDINCCCDAECSSDDLKAFSRCIEKAYKTSPYYCIRQDVLFMDSSPYASILTNDGHKCYESADDSQINDLSTTETLNTLEKLQEKESNSRSPLFPLDTSNAENSNVSYYKESDPLETLFVGDKTGYWSIPTSLTNGNCDHHQVIGYMRDLSSTCRNVITNVKDDCSSNAALNAQNYVLGFRISKVPIRGKAAWSHGNLVPKADNSTPVQPTISNLYTSSFSRFITVLICRPPTACVNITADFTPVPVYNATSKQCQNIVQSVSYQILHQGSDGIQSIKATVTLSTLASEAQSIQQQFSVGFYHTSVENTDSVRRSGNPGYVYGEPVIAGVVNRTSSQIILLQDRFSQMTIATPSSNGACGGKRATVTFGDDTVSDCIMTVNNVSLTDVCKILQSVVISMLLGTYQPDYAASFGNSTSAQLGDWVPIHRQPNPSLAQLSADQSVCSNVTAGLNIYVLYASAGAIANPQRRVIGVSYQWDSLQTSTIKCTGAPCTSLSPRSVSTRLRTTVQFIDSSARVVSYYASPAKDRIRYDIVAGFYTGSTQPKHSRVSSLFSFIIAVLVSSLI